VNGFIADAERDLHYSPAVARAYHSYLESNRRQLINRTASDNSYPLYQYLMERRMITAADFEALLQRANTAETAAALLEYQFRVLRQGGFEISLE
jgi:hypothetical protein